MAQVMVDDFLPLIRSLRATPHGYLWSTHDAEGEVLYINFKKPSVATDSQLTDDDIIIRYEDEEVIGLTVLHASGRLSANAPGPHQEHSRPENKR